MMCRTQVYLRCVDSLKFRKWVSFLSHSDNKSSLKRQASATRACKFSDDFGAVAHPLKKKDRSKSQKRLYNFGLLL